MKIGIILHSQTGNTFLVGQKLQEKLETNGHTVTLIRMKTISDTNDLKNIQLDNSPDASPYDGLIFGGWIQAFNLYPGVSMYLNQLPELKNKKITCFVTHFFPYEWMGGKNGISQMKKILSLKGANVIDSGIINWSRKKNLDAQINDLVEKLSKCY